MENFDVIQALARTALAGSSTAVTQQIERLAERLAAAGDDKSARSLRALVTRAGRAQAVEPLNLEASATGRIPRGQKLTLRTAVPVDRESGAPLAEVVFPDAGSALPVLPQRAEAAFTSLLHEWRHEQALATHNLPISRSLLIYGPPGTGKTTLGNALAARLGLPSVVARLDGLISSLLGNTARNLGSLFDFCNRYECVLLLDEFDAVAKVRDDSNEVGEIKRVVNALLQNLDKRSNLGLTIAITNHEQLLDSAIWRRFEHQIHLGLPDYRTRNEIAHGLLATSEDSERLSSVIAELTSGRSGADVRTLTIAFLKSRVLDGSNDRSPIALLRHAAAITGVADEDRLELSDAALAGALHGELPELSLGELGEIFSRDRKTIGRWLAMSE